MEKMSYVWRYVSVFEAALAGASVVSGHYQFTVFFALLAILSAATSAGHMVREALGARQ